MNAPMSRDVQRYECKPGIYDCKLQAFRPTMAPNDVGDWVLYADYAALRAALAETQLRREELTAMNDQLMVELAQAEQREQRLRAAVKDFVDSFERDHVLDGRLVDFPRIEHVRLYRVQKDALEETAPQAEPSPSPQGGDAPHRER